MCSERRRCSSLSPARPTCAPARDDSPRRTTARPTAAAVVCSSESTCVGSDIATMLSGRQGSDMRRTSPAICAMPVAARNDAAQRCRACRRRAARRAHARAGHEELNPVIPSMEPVAQSASARARRRRASRAPSARPGAHWRRSRAAAASAARLRARARVSQRPRHEEQNLSAGASGLQDLEREPHGERCSRRAPRRSTPGAKRGASDSQPRAQCSRKDRRRPRAARRAPRRRRGTPWSVRRTARSRSPPGPRRLAWDKRNGRFWSPAA
jgi:hypothetical protein